MAKKERFKTITERVYLWQKIDPERSLSKETMYGIINQLNSRRPPLSPLIIEIIMGDVDEVKKLIERGEDVNEVSCWGFTPLIVAVACNYPKMVEILLEAVADVNQKWNDYISPLLIACYNRNHTIIIMLLKGKARLDTDKEGYDALQYVINNGVIFMYNNYRALMIAIGDIRYDRYTRRREVPVSTVNQIIDLLCEYGIDVNYRNEQNGISTMSIAVENVIHSHRVKDDVRIIEKLIWHGVKKEVLEIDPASIYEWQDSITIDDLKDGDLSTLPDFPREYLRYLKYMHVIKKFDITVYAKDMNDGYRRSRFIKAYQG